MAEVNVRMYRQILGDCFLIRTEHHGKPWHALIDFGILQGSPDRADKTKAIVADIGATTGWKLDLLVATHEHADHISGFGQERQRFFGTPGTGVFDIGAVWLAWTEKLEDAQAKVMHDTRRVAGNAVRLAATIAPLAITRSAAAAQGGVANGDDGSRAEAATVAGLARFLAEGDDLGADASDDRAVDARGVPGDVFAAAVDLSGRFTGTRVMQALRQHPHVAYLEPGDAVAAGPMRAHVLGPPRSADFLTRSDPRKVGDDGEREVYLTDPERARALTAEVYRRFAMMGATLPEAAVIDADAKSPFPLRHHRPIADAVAEGDPVALAYVAEAESWRQITGAYLNAASELALQLDSDTNNTSLALAFELPDGQVLLFPADAQVGNWLSWGQQTYPKADPAGVDIAHLLSRVTLYKVGHHASHNATLRDNGLERMNDPRLSAMIPVDRDVAKSQKWAFPFPNLEARLREKTAGRLVLGDGDIAAETAAFANSPHARIAHGPDGLWVEVTVPVGAGRG